MSVKTMMIGTGVMFAGIAGMAANRISDGAVSKKITALRCGNSGNSINAASELAVCGLNTDMHWIIAMGVVFFIGVAINVYGRIKAVDR